MAKMNWNDIPDNKVTLEKSEYLMTIKSAEYVTTSNGYKAIQIVWESLESPKFTINYDNSIFGTTEKDFDMDNKAVRFGCAKLRAINEATVNLPDLDTDVLVKVLKGQKCIVPVRMDANNKYPEVDGYKGIRAYDESSDAIPDTASAPESFDVDPADDPFAL